MIKVTYETTKEDYVKFSCFVLKRRYSSKGMLIPLAIWLIGMIVLGAMLSTDPMLIVRDKSVMFTVVVLGGLPLYVFGVTYFAAILEAKRNYDNFPLQFAKKTIGFDEEGLHILSTATNENRDTKISWSYINNIFKTKEYIYVMQSKIVGYPIPVRIFDSEEQANKIFAELKSLFETAKAKSKATKTDENVVIDPN